MAPLFSEENVAEFDVIALQGPWRNTYHNTIFHPRKDIFELAYMDDLLTRVCFYINKKIALASWTVKFHSPDLCTLRIKTTTKHIFHIHNIYNPTAASEEPSKIPLLQTILENSPLDEHMVLGDFNLHHPNWGGPKCRSDLLASDLVILAEQYHLTQLVPIGTITYSEGLGKSTIDFFFATPLITESLLTCKIADSLDHHSDHMPITTTISLATQKAQPIHRRNWQKTDKKKLRYVAQNKFSKIPLLSEEGMRT